jgi:hypothetical protein
MDFKINSNAKIYLMGLGTMVRPIIATTVEMEIGRTMVQGQWAKGRKTPSQ